ncbi:hypothetical protein [Butyrivibrio sp. AE2015]|uniref:hypothetical protein n=1 Tax=Butyrivibrio sp. AE2015 TaxID=1280663 RepID=UPI0003B66749|nr:hypothetical protein [Butyrivibrio sp. AE2015]
MTVSKSQQKATNKYIKKQYDRINVTVPKGTKDIIKECANQANESVNSYICKAINMRMQSEQNQK